MHAGHVYTVTCRPVCLACHKSLLSELMLTLYECSCQGGTRPLILSQAFQALVFMSAMEVIRPPISLQELENYICGSTWPTMGQIQKYQFVYLLSMAASATQRQSCVAVSQTMWSASSVALYGKSLLALVKTEQCLAHSKCLINISR